MARRQTAPAPAAALAQADQAGDDAPGAGSPPNRGAAWRIALGCFWLMAVFLAYYAVHKPATADDLALLRAPAQAVSWGLGQTAARLLGAAADLLAVGWLWLAAGALGQALWRALRLPLPGRAAARLAGTVLGLGALGLVAFGLGLVGLLHLPTALLLLGLPVVLFWREALAQARWWWHAARGWWRAGWDAGAVERVALLFAAATSALSLLTALLPPTAWDALAYHLPIVRADTTAGRIVLDPASPQGYQPQLVEMLNALLALARGGDGAAAPLHAACGGLAVALVALLAWRVGGPRVSVRAGALALAIPLVTTIAGWAYVDLALAAAELAALAALAEWSGAHGAGGAGEADGMPGPDSAANGARAARGWLLVAGLCAGLALDIKYTAAYTLAALVPLIAFVAWRSARRASGGASWLRRLLAAARPTAAFAALALLVGCPWLLRNALVAGDPIFPYHLGTLLPQGPGWDPGRTAFMEGGGWGWSALWRAPLLPLEAILLGTQHSVEFDATLGPLLLALLPLGLLALGRHGRGGGGRLSNAPTNEASALPTGLPAGLQPADHPAPHLAAAPVPAPIRDTAFWRWPLAYAGVMWLVWAEELARSQVAMQGRLFLAPILALAVPAALAWTRLDAVRLPSLSLGRLANAAVLLCFAFTLAGQAVQTLTLDNLAELAGAQSRPAYLAQQLGPYAAAMAYLDTLGPSARVLFLWEPRTYLTTAQAEPDAFIDTFNTLYRHCGDAAGITRCLRA
ncbi:MAG TPA: phospholipid carrier-dependent glycosyltransferase, partial [Ktedonobacterales bacterium]